MAHSFVRAHNSRTSKVANWNSSIVISQSLCNRWLIVLSSVGFSLRTNCQLKIICRGHRLLKPPAWNSPYWILKISHHAAPLLLLLTPFSRPHSDEFHFLLPFSTTTVEWIAQNPLNERTYMTGYLLRFRHNRSYTRSACSFSIADKGISSTALYCMHTGTASRKPSTAWVMFPASFHAIL